MISFIRQFLARRRLRDKGRALPVFAGRSAPVPAEPLRVSGLRRMIRFLALRFGLWLAYRRRRKLRLAGYVRIYKRRVA